MTAPTSKTRLATEGYTTLRGTTDVTGVDTKLTLHGAKKTAMAVERDLAAIVPADTVTSIDQDQTGVLLSCEGDRAYQWTGQTKVMVASPPDTEAIVDAIVEQYDGKRGFAAKRRTEVDGAPGAQIVGEFGAGYIVGPSVDKTAIEILSFFPCFVLPDDLSPGDTYSRRHTDDVLHAAGEPPRGTRASRFLCSPGPDTCLRSHHRPPHDGEKDEHLSALQDLRKAIDTERLK